MRCATVLGGDVVTGVTALKRQDGGPILAAGSKTVVHTHDVPSEVRADTHHPTRATARNDSASLQTNVP